MEILDNVRQKFKDATLTAIKASNDFIETTKINASISSEEAKIKALMFDIGKMVYDNYKNGEVIEIELASKCDEIISIESSIEDMKLKILAIKNLRKCTGCDSEIDQSSLYCPNCGKKVEEVKEEEIKEEEAMEEKTNQDVDEVEND